MNPRQWLSLCALVGLLLLPLFVRAEDPSPNSLPPELANKFTSAGLPLKSFGVYASVVDTQAPVALATLNAEQPFLLASTTKVVTSLAALDLLGPSHRWPTRAFATGPVKGGRLAGDLVIVGANAGITPGGLSRWFRQMRSEGLDDISGRIVLERVAFLHDSNESRESIVHAHVRPAPGEPVAPVPTPVSAYTSRGAPGTLVVAVAPSRGSRAIVTLNPRPVNVNVVNDVAMGEGCVAWAVWESPDNARGGVPYLVVRGEWDASCGKRDVASIRAPASVKIVPAAEAATAAVMPTLQLPMMTAPPPALPATPTIVARLWREAGGRLAGQVVETDRWAYVEPTHSQPTWSSQTSIPLAEMLREMNKTSNNLAARSLLLSLADGSTMVKKVRLSGAAAQLRDAQDRVYAWLLTQGLHDGDIRVDLGSGQSRAERGKPRALVQLLTNAWRGGRGKIFLESLPIAGVDGTLAHRMLKGPATGQAFLKTGTLSDARALAGYVYSKSGKVYAVAAIVNHPKASLATPALDAFIEWIAKNG